MKTIISVIACFMSAFSFAQHVDTSSCMGVFMTAKDYTESKLSYSMNCNSSSGKIKTGRLFSQKYIEVISGRNKIKLKKDSVFGYRLHKQDFRINQRDQSGYRILENKNIVIYVTDVRQASSTEKTYILVPAYFFSNTISSEILPLTINNLKRAFQGNLKFHDILDSEFENDNSISVFDQVHNMYKINYLLSQSLSN
jgi:hypothetical protein